MIPSLVLDALPSRNCQNGQRKRECKVKLSEGSVMSLLVESAAATMATSPDLQLCVGG